MEKIRMEILERKRIFMEKRTTELTARVEAYIQKHQLLERGDHLVAGVSGGADSVCLLLVLAELQESWQLRLEVVHIDHGLRGKDAMEDADYVENLCEKYGFSCHVFHYPVEAIRREKHLSLEEAGRQVRYEAFEKVCRDTGATKIAVAHHKNDQAETVLFHLFRGTGLRGLAGMAPARGRVIRPLLCLERREIEAYLEERGIVPRQDATNLTPDYARNRIRLKLLPEAEAEINAKATLHVAQAAERLFEVQEYLDQETKRVYEARVEKRAEARLLQEVLSEAPPLIQKQVFLTCMQEVSGSVKDVSSAHLEALLGLWEKQTGRFLTLPGSLLACRTYEGILLKKKETAQAAKKEAVPVTKIPGKYRIGGWEVRFSIKKAEKNQTIPEKNYAKWFDYDKIKNSLLLRYREPGDFLEIQKEHGRKKLKDYFIDLKIPREERDQLLLLADGSHILWVVGGRISEACKVTEETERILEVQVNGGKTHE